jgi:hypothetical protein
MRSPILVLTLAALLVPLSAHAKLPAGTGITASNTVAGHLTATFGWTIAKSADPASQDVRVDSSTNVHWTITTTKSASGAPGAYFDGQVCVTNTGGRATQGLAIQDQVTQPPSTAILATASVDVSAKPQLNAGETHCYPYRVALPAAASIVPGATYKDTASVTITNQSCCPGTPTGPSASATAALPTAPIAIDASITVTDTNGQSFGFSDSGSQGYDQSFDCPGAIDRHTLHNTATIQSTGQTASADATIGCHVYPQSNTLEQKIDDELKAFTRYVTFGGFTFPVTNCTSIYLDTQVGQSCNTPCDGTSESEDHHQGLARTQELSPDHGNAIDFFLAHSEINPSTDRGGLMQFLYGGPVENEHVTGNGVVALLYPPDQSFVLDDEQHPSAIDFLPDMDDNDSGYLFVTKEFGLGGPTCGNDCSLSNPAACESCTSHKVTVYYWEPDDYLQPIGDIVTPLVKPSHVLIDRKDDYYYLIILDGTFNIGVPYRAYYADLFPGAKPGSMDLHAFQPLHYFSFNGFLGSQAKLVRDSDGWHVLAYTYTEDTGTGTANGDDYVSVRDITLGDAVTLGDGPECPPYPGNPFTGEPPHPPAPECVHIILPAGETGFTNTGTHYVDRNGRLLISSSYRWSHNESDAYGYVSRVDECAPVPVP